MNTPTDFERTGIFATAEQSDEMMTAMSEASATPVMLVGGVDLSASAWNRCFKLVDELAVAQGLPDLGDERYGFDPVKREFVRLRT